jgi:hypothetical protein
MKNQDQPFQIILYRDFYDIPQMFLARHRGSVYLFECSFDEGIDDYEDHFRVHLMPPIESLSLDGSWADLAKQSVRFLGRAKKSEMVFDPTRRAEMRLQPGVRIPFA